MTVQCHERELVAKEGEREREREEGEGAGSMGQYRRCLGISSFFFLSCGPRHRYRSRNISIRLSAEANAAQSREYKRTKKTKGGSNIIYFGV